MVRNEPAGQGAVDIARAANQRIWDFVHQPANVNLRAGTGYYSTPFRGGLFGEAKAAEVAKQLPTRGVDVLWFGSNPAVPRSLNNILNTPADNGDFPSFERQMASGFFGSLKWGSDGEPQADFNPIETPTHSWRVYRDLFEQIGRLECVAMANLIPWGSENMDDLITRPGSANRPLLRRALEFADDLNAEIIQTLAPRLAVVPFSLGRSDRLNAVIPFGLSLKEATDAKQHSVQLPEGDFNFYTATCQRGNVSVGTVFVRHPASLRVSSESQKRLVSEVAAILREFQSADPGVGRTSGEVSLLGLGFVYAIGELAIGWIDSRDQPTDPLRRRVLHLSAILVVVATSGAFLWALLRAVA